MFNRKSSVAAYGVVLGFLVAAASVHAMNPAHQALLTFSRPVSLPGVSLAAGTYLFEVANPETSSDVVRVRSKEDYRHVYFTGFTRRIDRPRTLPADRPIVLGEPGAGIAPPILAWFPEGAATGRAFVYPR
jgi:hypothetical protein